jgi:hypothetical protein
MITSIFPDTARISPEGRLLLGDVGVFDLAERIGTPLVLFDRSSFESRARARVYCSAVPSRCVFYAGKALFEWLPALKPMLTNTSKPAKRTRSSAFIWPMAQRSRQSELSRSIGDAASWAFMQLARRCSRSMR